MEPRRYSTPGYSRNGCGSVLSSANAVPIKTSAPARVHITARLLIRTTSLRAYHRILSVFSVMTRVARILVLLLSGALLALFAQSPGAFDHYLLSLSWSPEFCSSNPASAECGSGHHYGFIVHGLWPEFRNGGGPEYCSQ